MFRSPRFHGPHNLAAACRRSSAREVWPFAVLLLPAGESDRLNASATLKIAVAGVSTARAHLPFPEVQASSNFFE